jgi:hypothetical protein
MALQPFVGSWPLFSFLILYTLGRTPWMGGIIASQGHYLYTEQHKHRINAYRHPCLKWDSNQQPPVFKRTKTSCLRPRGHCDRHCLPCNIILCRGLQINNFPSFQTLSVASMLRHQQNSRALHSRQCTGRGEAQSHELINSFKNVPV